MDKLLNALGLMRVSEHEAKVSGLEYRLETYGNALRNRTAALDTCEDQNEKLETIIAGLQDEKADLAEQAVEIDRLNREIDGKIGVIDSLYARIDALTPDALLWRAARAKRSAKK